MTVKLVNLQVNSYLVITIKFNEIGPDTHCVNWPPPLKRHWSKSHADLFRQYTQKDDTLTIYFARKLHVVIKDTTSVHERGNRGDRYSRTRGNYTVERGPPGFRSDPTSGSQIKERLQGSHSGPSNRPYMDPSFFYLFIFLFPFFFQGSGSKWSRLRQY